MIKHYKFGTDGYTATISYDTDEECVERIHVDEISCNDDEFLEECEDEYQGFLEALDNAEYSLVMCDDDSEFELID